MFLINQIARRRLTKSRSGEPVINYGALFIYRNLDY